MNCTLTPQVRGRSSRPKACALWQRLLLSFLGFAACAVAQATGVPASGLNERDKLQAWLQRMVDASQSRAFTGTFVVSSSGSLSSARIWHVCEAGEQIERVDSLSGPPRSVFRHKEQVITFWPDTGLARSESRPSPGLFPSRFRNLDAALSEHYRLHVPGQVDRVAGVSAELFQLHATDKLRFGYRLWVEPHSALVVKLQTLDSQGRVLEQSAFSELQLDAPLKKEQLIFLMNRLEGYRLDKVQPVKTSLEAQGWSFQKTVPGFRLQHCQKRHAPGAVSDSLHCIFSDGLASVSLFLESAPAKTDVHETRSAMGATHTLQTQAQRHAVTLMGEVPPATLKLFASALERRGPRP